MNRVLVGLVWVLLVGVTGVGLAQGMTLAQAEAAGFECIDVGDTRGHCINARSGKAVATTVLVFGSTDLTASLIATEVLLLPDVYHGQPCPPEELEEWLNLGFARVCHHYVGP